MKSYKLSIRLMTYNQANYIEEALKGIDIQKTNFSFEVVVGDDFSPDDTLSKIRNYNFRNPNLHLRILKRELGDSYYKERKKKGRLYNFVDIINNCSGDYIALLDGDDYWTDPLKLQKQVDFLEENEEYVLTFHKTDVLKRNGEFENKFVLKVPENYETIETLVAKGNYIHTPSVVFRNKLKTFPFEFQYAPFGDFFLYFLLAEYGKLYYFEDNMAVYRQGIGVLSKMSVLQVANNNVLLYSCMLSFTTNEKIKTILFRRQREVVTNHYNQISKGPEFIFASNHKIFKLLKFLNMNIKNPLGTIKKIKRKWKQYKNLRNGAR